MRNNDLAKSIGWGWKHFSDPAWNNDGWFSCNYGLAYKKNVDDTRESVTFKIMELLEEKGALTDYNDPYIPKIKPTRKYKQFVGKKSVSLEKIDQYDLTAILTDHTSYDFKTIVDQSKIIVDTRNACGSIKSNKIVKA